MAALDVAIVIVHDRVDIVDQRLEESLGMDFGSSLALAREVLPQVRLAWSGGSIEYVRDPPRAVCTTSSGWTLGFVLHAVERHEGWVEKPTLKPIPLKPGMGWLVPPGAGVLARWRERCDYVDITLDDAAFTDLKLRPGDVRPTLENQDPVMVGLIMALLQSPARSDPLFCSSMADALSRHLCHVNSAGWEDPAKMKHQSSMTIVLEYIDANLSGSLDLATLSRTAGRSTSGLRRMFADRFGCSPYRYVLERRLDRAQQLILHTRLSVVECAVRSGFGTASYLTERLRRHRGMTPAALRRRGTG